MDRSEILIGRLIHPAEFTASILEAIEWLLETYMPESGLIPDPPSGTDGDHLLVAIGQ